MTEERYVCLTPTGVENDDLVCLLKGARRPFIIRQMSSDFMLVGEAYVHVLKARRRSECPRDSMGAFQDFLMSVDSVRLEARKEVVMQGWFRPRSVLSLGASFLMSVDALLKSPYE